MSLVTSAATNKMQWNAADYAANSAVQQSWAREVIAKLHLRGDEHVLDVGCGDGKVTAELARAVPHGSVVGTDASAEMIAFAKKSFPPSKIPGLRFEICDARAMETAIVVRPERRAPSRHVGDGSLKQAGTVPGAPFDLVFSNAALHWVDDHEAILRGAAAVLKTGGRLVVSCGGKGNAHDVFLALRPEMRLKRWCKFFRRMPLPYHFYTPENYEKWLPKFGFKINTLKLTPKDAAYDGAEGFATWLRTTWLPFVQRVPDVVGQASSLSSFRNTTGKMPVPLPSLREEFIAAVTTRYLAKHPPDKSGQVHVRMVRLEIEAVKI
ncbi:MAG TPA: methyltransferase domain-containing protein [Verrucomicrobiae bacterium]